MCDLRVCSDKAKMAESYIMMGVVPGDAQGSFRMHACWLLW
jgi:enoyl-CoA hydratase/carnithine racemase